MCLEVRVLCRKNTANFVFHVNKFLNVESGLYLIKPSTFYFLNINCLKLRIFKNIYEYYEYVYCSRNKNYRTKTTIFFSLLPKYLKRN